MTTQSAVRLVALLVVVGREVFASWREVQLMGASAQIFEVLRPIAGGKLEPVRRWGNTANINRHSDPRYRPSQWRSRAQAAAYGTCGDSSHSEKRTGTDLGFQSDEERDEREASEALPADGVITSPVRNLAVGNTVINVQSDRHAVSFGACWLVLIPCKKERQKRPLCHGFAYCGFDHGATPYAADCGLGVSLTSLGCKARSPLRET